jgi:RNA-binding protein YhbY
MANEFYVLTNNISKNELIKVKILTDESGVYTYPETIRTFS